MKFYSALILSAAALTLSACSAKKETFASQARLQGDEYASIAKNWEEGKELVEDGEAKVKKGKKQIKKGRELIDDGEENQKDGLELISKGKKLITQSEAAYNKRSKLVTE